jgi:hypothetical protein
MAGKEIAYSGTPCFVGYSQKKFISMTKSGWVRFDTIRSGAEEL